MIHKPYNVLQGYMRQNGITVRDLAELIGVTPTTISFKINGKSDFTLSEVDRIKKHYGVGYEIFLQAGCENNNNIISPSGRKAGDKRGKCNRVKGNAAAEAASEEKGR